MTAADRERHAVPTAVGEVVAAVARQRDWQYRLGLNQVFLFWDQVVDSEVAAEARPEVIHGRELTVAVRDPVRAQQLQYESAELLTRINKRLAAWFRAQGEEEIPPLLEAIRLVPRQPEPPAPSLPERPPAPVVDAAELARFESLCAAVGDPRVRESMKRLWLATRGR